MKKPWKKSTDDTETTAAAAADSSATESSAASSESSADSTDQAQHDKSYTPKKGRPTPKRNEVERAHGYRKKPYSAPTTGKEARQRRKDLKSSMTKEEYAKYKKRKRDERARERQHNRERMLSGDERFLLARDRGPERRLIRDWVDSRRRIVNFFMPMALLLLLFMMVATFTRNLLLNDILSIVGMVMMSVLIIDGILLSRKCNRCVRERYPDTDLSNFGMGFYAFQRASMVRSMRSPRPQVNIGDSI